MTIVLPAVIPTGGGGSPTPPIPPAPPRPAALTITASQVDCDCEGRLPGVLPGIELTIASYPPANIVGLDDASFEDGIGSAMPFGCIIDTTTAEALDGTHSLMMQCTTAGASAGLMGIRLGPYPVIPGNQYTITANIRGGDSRSVGIEGTYYNGSTDLGPGGAEIFTDNASSWLSDPPFLILSAAPLAANQMIITLTVESPQGPIPAPAGLSVAVEGSMTGHHTYGYVVTSYNSFGETRPGALVQTNAARTTLSSGTNYQQLSWTAATGATGYRIYRGSPALCGGLTGEFTNCADLLDTVPTCAALLTFVSVFGFLATTTSTSYADSTNGTLGAAPPMTDTSGEPAFVDEVGGWASTTIDEWVLNSPGTTTVIRDDGLYVQGASPLFPLQLDELGMATIIDYDAAYGLEATYVAVLTQLGRAFPPSAQSNPVMMGQAPRTCELYGRLGWAKEQDALGVLEQWLSGIGEAMETLASVSADSYDDAGNIAPSWSTILDIERCPTPFLPWLGQFVGARVPSTLRDDQQRYLIGNAPGWQRGSVAAILAAAGQFLVGGNVATITERTPDPYSLTVMVPNAGIVGTATCESLYLGYATCASVLADFSTCAALWAGVDEVETSILAAIPAGLVASVSFI